MEHPDPQHPTPESNEVPEGPVAADAAGTPAEPTGQIPWHHPTDTTPIPVTPSAPPPFGAGPFGAARPFGMPPGTPPPPPPGAPGVPLPGIGQPGPTAMSDPGGVPMWGEAPTWDPAVDRLAGAGAVHNPPANRSTGGWRWAVVALVAALVGSGIGGGIVAATTNHGGGTTTVRQISAGPALLNGTTDIQKVIAKVLPAVVSINASAPQPGGSQSIFGGSGGGGSSTVVDQGTGMIITSNGEVVTNNHVISGATTITVTLYGQTKAMPATLVDTDPSSDVALLKITGASNLPTVSLGNSNHVQVGDAVVAIGNALGLSAGTPTVTQGIISAKGRTVTAGNPGTGASETLSNMFQTDAAINPGNSGGPLVDSSGQVIGMNTAVAASASGSSQAQNIGFAIPVNTIAQLLPSLRNHSIPNQPSTGTAFLGVSLETLTSQLRSAYNFVPTQGAVVLQVVTGSPADVAGLQQGDVIVSFDNKPVTSAEQLAAVIQRDHPGQSVTIGIYRGQARLTVTATLASNSALGAG